MSADGELAEQPNSGVPSSGGGPSAGDSPVSGGDGPVSGGDETDDSPTSEAPNECAADEQGCLPDAGSADSGEERGSDTTERDAATPEMNEPPDDAAGGDVDPPSTNVPEQPAGTVPMFVAVGHAGRTVVSCDDGESWVGERSDDPDRRCFDATAGDIDCDHSSDAGTGIAYGNGWFVATFGWGAPGTIRRSNNGINWEVVAEGNDEDNLTSSGLAWGLDTFLTGARNPRTAGPDALSWVSAPALPLGDIWNVRQIAFAPVGGGTFLMFAQDAEAALATSTNGEDWSLSPTGAEHCTGNNIVYGNGVLLMLGDGGCRSGDGGETWTPVELPASARTPTLWTGTQFVYWGLDESYQDAMYTSVEGWEWEATPATSDGGVMRLGPVARSPDGTYVGVRGEWQQWYEAQRFYRSEDGARWTEVAEGDYTGSHPLRQIVFGYGQPSEACSVE